MSGVHGSDLNLSSLNLEIKYITSIFGINRFKVCRSLNLSDQGSYHIRDEKFERLYSIYGTYNDIEIIHRLGAPASSRANRLMHGQMNILLERYALVWQNVRLPTSL